MQFTTGLFALALAAVGAVAAPNAEVEARQNTGIFFIQFFTEPGCAGTMIDAQTFVASNSGCQAAESRVANYPSFRVRQTDGVSQPIKLFSQPGCTGTSTTVQPNVALLTCITQKVGSAQFV